MNYIYFEGNVYLNLYVFMESKKYEGTPLEEAILSCKNMRSFYKLTTPQIVNFEGKKSFKVKYEDVIYEPSPEYLEKKYQIFRKVALRYKNTLMYYAMLVLDVFDSSKDFDEAVIKIFKTHEIKNFCVTSIEKSLMIDKIIEEYWGNKNYLKYAPFIAKLIMTIYEKNTLR